MSQNVVYDGQDFVFAFHPDELDLTGVYVYPWDTGGTPPTIVPTPRDFVYAFDELGRRLDPRRFAGDGGTPIGTAHALPAGASSSPPHRPAPAVTAPVVPPAAPPPDPEAA
jgi:hypothetical protein